MAGGRPSKYKKAYCKQIIEWAKEDTLPLQWTGKLEIARSTLNKWVENYPEFSEAWEKAKEICLENWLNKAIDSSDQFELTKAKYLLSIAFRVSETQKIEAKQEIEANVKNTVELKFGDRPDV